jgi:hypothetical protein
MLLMVGKPFFCSFFDSFGNPSLKFQEYRGGSVGVGRMVIRHGPFFAKLAACAHHSEAPYPVQVSPSQVFLPPYTQ